MKITVIILLGLSLATANAQFREGAHVAQAGNIRSASSSGSAFDRMSAPAVVYSPRDPHRVFGTNVYRLAGIDPQHGFVAFQGTVIHAEPGIIVLAGTFTGCDGSIVFCVTNFPYIFGEQQKINVGDDQMFYVARMSGTYNYISRYGAQQNVRMLDYGTIYVPKPKDDATLKAETDKQQKQQSDSVARAVKMNQDLADKGDEYGLLRMGERYRDGDGVEKDLNKAKDYLGRAATAGSPSAKAELEALNK